MKNCTILIATYNRTNYLKRILSYYTKYGRNFEIIVADSSSNENKKLNSEYITSLSNNNILHLKYPTSIKPFCEKIPDALNYVKTEYCVNCAEDDFIIPNAIKKSIDFLEKNPDFSCVQGYYISFYLKGNYLPTKKFIYTPFYTNYKSNIFKNAKNRLFSNFVNFMHTIYSVHRTNFMKILYRETSNYTDDDRFSELLPSMLDLVYGKMKKLDYLYCAREMISDSGGGTSKNLRDFIKEDTYEIKYVNFKNCLAKHLAKNSQLSIDESKEVIDKAMPAYFKKHYSKNYKHILIHKMSNLLDTLDLPESVNKGIRMLYKKLFTPKYIINNLKEIDDFKKEIESPNSKYFDDFEKIRNHVLLYAKNDN